MDTQAHFTRTDPTAEDDAVLAHLDAAADAYRARAREWEERWEAAHAGREAAQAEAEESRRELEEGRRELEGARRERDAARAEAEEERRALEETRRELDETRRGAERQRHRAETLAQALKDIHRTLFRGNVYEMILRACLAITGAGKGLYVTSRAGDGRLRVRAAVGIEGYPQAELSPFLEGLCRRVLQQNEPLVCNDGAGDGPEGLPAPDRADERFRNYVASPVVLMRNLDGVVVVADKATGGFHPEDVETLLSVGDQAAVAVENRHLEKALQSAYVSTVSMLADAVEAKDPYTHGHCEMASRFARLVADRLELPDRERAVVCYAALLHDVGKIGVSDGVLHKPGPLLPEEVELMRAHVRVGHDLLSSVPALEGVADVVLHHHERFDGTGYPDGLAGEEIPLPARIVSVVDAYCAMITRRAYKEAYSAAEARQELVRCSGTQFDPAIVEVFLAVLDSGESADTDDDPWAECTVLPDFADMHRLRHHAAALTAK